MRWILPALITIPCIFGQQLDGPKRASEDEVHAAILSKTFVSVEIFKTALMHVMAATEDNFRPILGNRTNDHLFDYVSGERYYSKVTLPKLDCRVMLDLSSSTKSVYRCLLESGYFTPSLKLAYENLVETVRLATGLPERTPNNIFKTETRPGSRVLEGDRTIIFARAASDTMTRISMFEGTYIEVSLLGHGGINGHWTAELKVGIFPR